MNNLTLKTVTLLSLVLLSACSTSNKTTHFIPVVTADKATVYIYRPVVMANAMYSPDLYVNKEFKLSLKSGNNTRLTFIEGEHTFEIEPDKNYDGITHTVVNLSVGNTYYLRVDSGIQISDTAQYTPYKRSFNLITVDPVLATKQIAKCCTIKTKSIKNSVEINSERGEPNDGFSVDKTQNPFSH